MTWIVKQYTGTCLLVDIVCHLNLLEFLLNAIGFLILDYKHNYVYIFIYCFIATCADLYNTLYYHHYYYDEMHSANTYAFFAWAATEEIRVTDGVIEERLQQVLTQASRWLIRHLYSVLQDGDGELRTQQRDGLRRSGKRRFQARS